MGDGGGRPNIKKKSGVDEAWTTGTPVGQAVVELLRAGQPSTKENLAATYETRRRESRVFFQAEDGIRDPSVTGVQTSALPISASRSGAPRISIPGRLRQARRACRKTSRSEERRVGKEGRSRWSPDH